MFARPAALCVILVLTGGLSAALGQTIDPHQLYEQKCAGCHVSHAGDFVRASLIESGEKILGRKSGRELDSFLEAGHGNLDREEIGVMISHLTAIQLSGGLFRDKCRTCHDKAVTFAREYLFVKDGVLTGRYSNRDIERFLSGHGRLNPDEVSKMVDVLMRQLDMSEE